MWQFVASIDRHFYHLVNAASRSCIILQNSRTRRALFLNFGFGCSSPISDLGCGEAPAVSPNHLSLPRCNPPPLLLRRVVFSYGVDTAHDLIRSCLSVSGWCPPSDAVTANMLSSFTSETKQQGAAEAARDPDSSVTAEDAERVFVEESQKAGATALQFDPDATPEEKAAQAKAVSSMQ